MGQPTNISKFLIKQCRSKVNVPGQVLDGNNKSVNVKVSSQSFLSTKTPFARFTLLVICSSNKDNFPQVKFLAGKIFGGKNVSDLL
jgi:hypothetical protein